MRPATARDPEENPIRAVTRTRLAFFAAAAFCLLVVPIAAAGAVGGSDEPRASASASVKKQVKKLNKKFKKLQAQFEEVSKQSGPQGPQGDKGEQGEEGDPGPQGPSGSANAWGLVGNAGTNPANQFVGTTEQPFNLRVADARALRLEPASDGTNQSPNVIGGIADNQVEAGVHSATIAGGGRNSPAVASTANRVTDHRGTVGGGVNNQAGDDAGTVGDRTIATVSGGASNTASGLLSTVGGGITNTASGESATLAGGASNTASGSRGTVGGGELNTASELRATVAGGSGNTASGGSATVGGGITNTAGASNATVGGGTTNTASAFRTTVSGGTDNIASAFNATVSGGGGNIASAGNTTVSGGSANTASGDNATVGGGNQNTAAGDYSFVVGRQAKNADASHDGVFLFADASLTDFDSTAANEFAARAAGGFRFRTSADLSTGCNLAAGSGTFACTSDRKSKSGFAAVNPREVLAQLERLPIESWTYKADPAQVRHIGPTAQVFKRAFGFGEDPRTISAVDADGVALAAIKGLNSTVEEQESHITRLESRISALERDDR